MAALRDVANGDGGWHVNRICQGDAARAFDPMVDCVAGSVWVLHLHEVRDAFTSSPRPHCLISPPHPPPPSSSHPPLLLHLLMHRSTAHATTPSASRAGSSSTPTGRTPCRSRPRTSPPLATQASSPPRASRPTSPRSALGCRTRRVSCGCGLHRRAAAARRRGVAAPLASCRCRPRASQSRS